jgi:hypothetical protein
MDLTPIQSGDWIGWWRVSHPTKLVLRYIKYSIPNAYRNMVNGVWYVHEKYVDSIRQIDASAAASTEQPSDPYAVLHLLPTAPPAIIKAAWRELAKILHPDHGGDSEAFMRAKTAYETLMTKR